MTDIKKVELEFHVGQEISGDDYDRLPVGTKFAIDANEVWNWKVLKDGFRSWSGVLHRHLDPITRIITHLPEPELEPQTLRIEHTLVGASIGDEVWHVDGRRADGGWPARITRTHAGGGEPDRATVEYQDGTFDTYDVKVLTTTPPKSALPPEPPVWSVVTTVDEYANQRDHFRNMWGWHSSDRVTRTWAEVCALDANGTPTLRTPEVSER